MQINWPLVMVLFFLSLPGVFIAIPRLIHFLLPDNSETLRKRISRIAVSQSLIMVMVMSFVGSLLSVRTGLTAPILDALLQGQFVVNNVQAMLLPVFLYTLGGLLVFFVLYYGVVASILDENTQQIMQKMHAASGLDGCVLYSGIAEEILVRWGLMNMVAFFAMLLTGSRNTISVWTAILVSGMLFSLGQVPVYLAAGCQPHRRFIYSIFMLNTWQAILFGWLFWQYGLLASIISHMLFHFGWFLYEQT
ncbi:type II CAAX prenyl endopeptidase Rce1 family protein [Legionella fairfieldensis]|uniref:CPBP family glutamic-type intramembrane protease n=1 Tax=Legionella fairfieldensis TaxID=45064 RepID=UPI00048E48DA|nr:CPBP family glutamic-type intramembrane protease [Legionella fairfieldensis]